MNDEQLIRAWIQGFEQGVKMNGHELARTILAKQASVCWHAWQAWERLVQLGVLP